MKRLISSALVVSFAIVQPIHASDVIRAMERAENPVKLLEQLLCPSGTFDADEARAFLFQLKSEIRAQHGIDLDLNLVIDEAIRSMTQMGHFSEAEIATAREFYSQLIQEDREETRVSNARQSGKKKHKDKSKKKKKGQELVLPDNMALGFMCILGGSLLCLLPFGVTQGLGASFIVGGVIVIGQGAAQGEKPYHVDSETGHPISPNNEPQGPSIGVGIPI